MRLVRTPASHTSLASLSRSFVDAASLWDNKQEIPSDLYEMFYEILHSWNKQVLRHLSRSEPETASHVKKVFDLQELTETKVMGP